MSQVLLGKGVRVPAKVKRFFFDLYFGIGLGDHFLQSCSCFFISFPPYIVHWFSVAFAIFSGQKGGTRFVVPPLGGLDFSLISPRFPLNCFYEKRI